MTLEQIKQRYSGKADQEWDRLNSTPITRIEYAITSHCLNKHLPGTGLILDAGSGPGRYSVDLAYKGYHIVMFDLLHEMLHLGQIKAVEASIHEQIVFSEGNIADLPFKDHSFDAVISLGAPISHLTDAQARSNAVAEMTRVVRPGGKVFLTGLTRLACYRGAVYWIKKPEFFEQISRENYRSNGICVGSQVWYNFSPWELEELIQSAGLQIVDRVGCEGLANHLPLENLEQIEANPQYWSAWKEILLETSNEPSIIGISNHLLVVACKP